MKIQRPSKQHFLLVSKTKKTKILSCWQLQSMSCVMPTLLIQPILGELLSIAENTQAPQDTREWAFVPLLTLPYPQNPYIDAALSLRPKLPETATAVTVKFYRPRR